MDVQLEYYCPQCSHRFKSEVWKVINCSKCNVKIETDWIEDEYAGIIGTCFIIKEFENPNQ